MARLPKEEQRKFWVQYQRLCNLDRLKACEYGHFDCSIREGGPCMNENSPSPFEANYEKDK